MEVAKLVQLAVQDRPPSRNEAVGNFPGQFLKAGRLAEFLNEFGKLCFRQGAARFVRQGEAGR